MSEDGLERRHEDVRLAARVRSGDVAALGELYDRYAGRALGTALRVLGERTEAEDVVHDAFMTVWRRIDGFDPQRGSLASWLTTIVRNRAIDRVRARRTGISVEDADDRSLLRTGPNPTWEATIARASADELRAAIDALPDEQRRAVELAYFQGYTYRDVARLTNVPPGTANGRLRLALRKLREALAGTAAAPPALEVVPVAEESRP